jgi:hypothetical protein
MPHWIYLLSAANALISLFTWRNLPLAIVRLVGALTKDSERSKRCAEILRLARKDAKDLPSYLASPPEPGPATKAAVSRSRDQADRRSKPASLSPAPSRASRRRSTQARPP